MDWYIGVLCRVGQCMWLPPVKLLVLLSLHRWRHRPRPHVRQLKCGLCYPGRIGLLLFFSRRTKRTSVKETVRSFSSFVVAQTAQKQFSRSPPPVSFAQQIIHICGISFTKTEDPVHCWRTSHRVVAGLFALGSVSNPFFILRNITALHLWCF